MTLAEEREKTTPTRFAVKYSVDEEDCFDFAKGFAKLHHNVYFVNWRDLNGLNGNPDNGGSSREFSRMFHYNLGTFIPPVGIDAMDLIFVYKQEGFLKDLPAFERILTRFEGNGAVVVNNPGTIRWNMSKAYLFDMAKNGIRIVPTYELTPEITERIKRGERFILKPKIGERGLEQCLVTSVDDLKPFMQKPQNYLAQIFCPQIRRGERSLVFLGRRFSHAVLKTPNPHDSTEYRCNESRGGKVAVYVPTKKEQEFAQQLFDYTTSIGHPPIFSRIDLIDIEGEPVLMEAEMLNPSIYANYSGIGLRFGIDLADYFNKLMRTRK